MLGAICGDTIGSAYEFLNLTYGWDSSCQGTVPEAIIAFLESTDFEDAIRKAVSIGGDSDTLACITGGIAEAYYKEIVPGCKFKVLEGERHLMELDNPKRVVSEELEFIDEVRK